MNQKSTPNQNPVVSTGSSIQKNRRGFVPKVSTAFLALALTGWVPAWSAGNESEKEEKVAEFVRTNMDNLENRVRSTLMFGGSSPVSFMGEARIFAQYHNASQYPEYMSSDNNWTSINWGGNANLIRLGMIAKAGRSAVLWAKLGFQHTFPGTWQNGSEDGAADDQDRQYDAGNGYEYSQGRHDGNDRQVNIHEDMSAGLAIRTKQASFWVRMGNTMWTEASPFTIWKSQPRTFAWDYLPFEVEQPIQRYYEYNIAKGEKDGRAAWNKKPFNGINIESINLPGNMYANFVYGAHERYDNLEREYIDWSGDVGLTDIATEAKSTGLGDRWRRIIHGRVAHINPETGFTLGANFVKNTYNDKVFTSAAYSDPSFDKYPWASLRIVEQDTIDRSFYKESSTYSVDYFQKFGDWSVKGDIALNQVDTTWQFKTTQGLTADQVAAGVTPNVTYTKSTTTSDMVPAIYAHVEGDVGLPLKLDLSYIGRHFYSPFSFVAPVDGFYAFNSNMVGAGKFIGRGEGSPYVGNMAGILASVQPDVGYGHLKITYGLHTQLEEAPDRLYIPYRLNGQDLFSLFHSSYQRWGNGNVYDGMNGGNKLYMRRLGDESYASSKGSPALSQTGNPVPFKPLSEKVGKGGLTTDYLSTFESFVPYMEAAQAEANRMDEVNMLEVSSTLPTHQKSTWNFEVDYAKDIGSWFGYKKDLLMGFYYAANGVSADFSPFKMGDESLLYSHYFRFEPAIAITNKFYVLGLFGLENWNSNNAWTFVPNFFDRNASLDSLKAIYGVQGTDDLGNQVWEEPTRGNGATDEQIAAYGTARDDIQAKYTAYRQDPAQWGRVMRTPIDYLDLAYGIGFDWDVAPRVGLHYRVKFMSHTDRGLNDVKSEFPDEISHIINNDYDMMIMSGEIKMWF